MSDNPTIPPPATAPESATTDIAETLQPENRVYDENHVCPIKEARLQRRHRPRHPVVKWLSRFVMVLVAFPMLLVLGFIGAVSFMDFNQYKPQLEETFQQRTGYPLNIDGEIKVSPWPLSIEMTHVSVQDKVGDKVPDLVEMTSVLVELSLWDLFVHRRLNMQGIELNGARIYLHTHADGRSNWQGMPILSGFFAADSDEAQGSGYRKVAYVPVNQSQPEADAETKSMVWRLHSFVSQDAALVWQNDENGHRLTLSDFNLMAHDIAPEKPFRVITDFGYTTNVVSSRFQVSLATHLTLDSVLKKWRLSDWTGNVRLILPDEMKVPEVRVETDGAVFEVDLGQKAFHVKQARFISMKTQIATTLEGRFGADASSQGHMDAHNIELKKWFRHAGAAYPHFVRDDALQSVSAQFDWSQDARALKVSNLNLLVDGARLEGHFQKLLPKPRGSEPVIQFDLSVSTLDLDRYEAYVEPPKPTSAVGSAAKGTGKGAGKTAKKAAETYLPIGLPVATLKDLQAEGHLSFGQLKAWNRLFSDVALTVQSKDGQAKVDPLNANLYQGHLHSQLAMDVTGKTPSYRWNGRLQDVAIQPFLADGWQYHQLSGFFTGTFNLQTQGVNAYLLRQNMNGQVRAQLKDGAFIGMDLNKLLAGQKTHPQDTTQFQSMALVGAIQQGLMRVTGFEVKSQRFSATGVGELALTSGLLEGTLFTVYQNPPKALSSLKGVKVPVFLKGPLQNLQWSVDMDGVLNDPGNQQKLRQSLQQLFNPKAS